MKMKRWLALALCLLMLVTAAACKKDPEPSDTPGGSLSESETDAPADDEPQVGPSDNAGELDWGDDATAEDDETSNVTEPTTSTKPPRTQTVSGVKLPENGYSPDNTLQVVQVKRNGRHIR